MQYRQITHGAMIKEKRQKNIEQAPNAQEK